LTSDARSRYVFTSYSNDSNAHLTFYARSNWVVDDRTFRISIYPNYTFTSSLSNASLSYSLMNFVFFVICISCVFRLCKVIFLKCRNIRINVVEDNESAVRERHNQQELNLIFTRVQVMDMTAQREEREKARKEKHMKEARTLMELMERTPFDSALGDKYDLKDCVICSDEFVQGEELARVPIC